MLFCNFIKVNAADTFELGDDVVATSAYRVKSKKYIGLTYGSFKTFVSNVSGAKTDNEKLSATISISYSNSISGNLSLSIKKNLKATMGFDVTKSSSVSTEYSINLKKGQKCKIKARPAYDTYNCKLERLYTGTGIYIWREVSGTYTAKNYSHIDFEDKLLIIKEIIWNLKKLL